MVAVRALTGRYSDRRSSVTTSRRSRGSSWKIWGLRQGEAKDSIADGAIGVGGCLPINTHGEQLGEAYIHG